MTTAVAMAAGALLAGGPAAATTTVRPAADAACSADWSVMPTDSPFGDLDISLAVDALTRSDAWSVGWAAVDGATRPLALHFDGTSWARTPIADPTEAVLTGVTMLAADDVFAVGYVDVGLSETKPYAIHWNGTAWRRVGTPSTRMGTLLDVASNAAGDVWAVGMVRDAQPAMMALRFDGTRFVEVPTPAVSASFVALTGVDVADDGFAWAVGYSTNSQVQYRPLSIHWDGTSWARQRVPDLGTEGSALEDVVITESNRVWAVGWRTSEAGTQPIALLRDGEWFQPAPPTGEESRFESVDELPDGRIVAVGFTGSHDLGFTALSEVYDGSWHDVPAAPIAGDERFHGVASVPGRTMTFAVGERTTEVLPNTLIERRCG
ncbi:MAG TPA: hypothetical protein VGB14_05645 [Acidimicrobiales bacterium]